MTGKILAEILYKAYQLWTITPVLFPWVHCRRRVWYECWLLMKCTRRRACHTLPCCALYHVTLILYHMSYSFYTRSLIYCCHILECHIPLILPIDCFVCLFMQCIIVLMDIRNALYHMHRFMSVMKDQRWPPKLTPTRLFFNVYPCHVLSWRNSPVVYPHKFSLMQGACARHDIDMGGVL